MLRARPLPVVAVLAAATALAGCASGPDSAGPAGATGEVRVVASFYPLQWTAQRVAGAKADVVSLTKPGAEPHDLELAPQDVASLADADLVVYLKGFQPAVDDAVAQEGDDHAFDVSRDADLDLTYTPIEGGRQESSPTGARDPHFWLDPVRLAAVGDAVAARLGRLRPENAAQYETNAAALRVELEALDAEYTAGLADCANMNLVTSHNSFGYLARRYGLTQVGITGLTPEDEPNPQDLADVTTFVEENDVRTIYYETLVSPAVARTVADETGARTAVLDPVEGLTDESAGADYLAVMRANLATIRAGQPCT